MGTLATATIAVFTFDPVPDLISWQKWHITQRTVLGFSGPIAYQFELRTDIIEKASLPSQGKFKPAFAQVIASALCQSSYESLWDTIIYKRYVFID